MHCDDFAVYIFKDRRLTTESHNFKSIRVVQCLSPLCPKNDDIENTEHFLLLCHEYHGIRGDLVISVDIVLQPLGLTILSKTLLQIILFGHEKLSPESFSKALEATMKYIRISERFQ